MKKVLLFVIIVLSLHQNLNAQIKFEQGFGVEFLFEGGALYRLSQFNAPSLNKPNDVDYIDFNKGKYSCLYTLDLSYKNLSITSLTTIYMNKGESYQFAPTFSEFTISLNYKIKHVIISLSHTCVHSMISETVYKKTLSGGVTKIRLYYKF